jgi:Glucose / Sorbosone dehydrogenase
MTRRAALAGLVAGVALAAAGAAPAVAAAQAGGGLRLVKLGTFSSPLFVGGPPGDPRRAMVVERDGRIWVVRDGRRLPRPFLDIHERVIPSGEQGLLGLAFAPDYQRTGRFYVYYSENGTADNTVVEFHRSRLSADRADPASARKVLSMHDGEANHNGGMLAFGPDRLLYVATGDGGGANDFHGMFGNAQNLGSLLGKILRIDPRAAAGRPYRVPASNPFVNRAGALPEIYAYGLRNPFRFSFDRRTGDIAIGDVGQSVIEEIDFMRRGRARSANFGWRPWEGRRLNFNEQAPFAIFPVITHTHESGFCSIIGGYVVRDPGVPRLTGRYVYSDLCDSRIRVITLREGRLPHGRPLALSPKIEQVSSFGEDARGRIYVTSILGAVYRIAASR